MVEISSSWESLHGVAETALSCGSAQRAAVPPSGQDSSDLGYGPIDVVVHDHGVELLRPAMLLGRPAASRRSICSGSSVPRASSRRRCSSRDGGRTNTSSASGILAPHGERALDVDLEQHVVAGGEVLGDELAGVPFRSP